MNANRLEKLVSFKKLTARISTAVGEVDMSHLQLAEVICRLDTIH